MWQRSVSRIIIRDKFILKRSIIFLQELLLKTSTSSVKDGATVTAVATDCAWHCVLGRLCLRGPVPH